MAQQISFYKYQGAGNDFVLIDNRDGSFDRADHALVKRLCDRRFGIGGDGLMLLQDSVQGDFEMVYYNADGREGSMCGNGGRCIVSFAHDLNIIRDKTVFLAVDGKHDASISNNIVELGMIDVKQHSKDGDAYLINTGSPHYVKFSSGVEQMNVYDEGYSIRNSTPYKTDGINVNFVEKEQNGYFCRTFERGVEDETLACGTGATAAAMAIALEEDREGEIQIPIRVLGGQLSVSFHKDGNDFSRVYLSGPAIFVFKGEISL